MEQLSLDRSRTGWAAFDAARATGDIVALRQVRDEAIRCAESYASDHPGHGFYVSIVIECERYLGEVPDETAAMGEGGVDG